MKKILIGVVSLLVASAAYADTCGANLTGAFTAAQAVKLCSVLGSASFVLNNNTYLVAKNAAGTANINVLKVDATDDTVLDSDTGDVIKLANAGTTVVQVTSAGIRPELDGDNATSNLGTSTAGFKNIHFSDATNRSSILQSNGLYASYPVGQSMFFREASTDRWAIRATSGDLASVSSGNTLALQEASAAAACMGGLTTNGATPVVTATTCATTGSRIFLSRTSAETGTVSAWISALSTGVSFSVTSEAADTGTYNWIIFHEAP